VRSRSLLPYLVLAGACALPATAQAQYRNYTFGFEGGYSLLTAGTELKPHNFALGIFGGWKSSDHWWFSGRALISFPGQLDNAPNTVIHLHFVPISVQYYFSTDTVRPYLGLTNSFQIFFNGTENIPDALWGPGLDGGLEFKLRRDLFLGFKTDLFWMLRFEGSSAFVFTATSQIIFFL
jgi:hypothetical protein